MSVYTYIEAEDFSQSGSTDIRNGAFASGGQYVQHVGSDPLSIWTDIEGRPGTYDIAVSYFDENDGESSAALKVDGVLQDAWTWSEQLGSSYAGTKTLTTHVIKNVTLDEDARIQITGSRDAREEMRIDNIELRPASQGVASSGKPAFEGAEGFGAVTDGGRGGVIVKVTTLADSGEGSLRWALEELDMPRIVVFEVGGRINLSEEIEVRGDVTVAGQTAPGEGITVSGARLHVVESDVIIQGLKIRPGVTSADSIEDRDAISIGSAERDVSRVMIDHNSFSWAIDETAVVWFGAHDVTFSNNIFAEGLDNSQPSYGMLLADGAHRISVIDNLFANNFHRNPQLLGAKQVEFINNVVSNYGDNGFEAPVGGSNHVTANIIGNVFVEGHNSSDANPIRLRGKTDQTEYYLKDNIGASRPDDSMPESAIAEGWGVSLIKDAPVFSGSGVSVLAASDVLEAVLGNVGARGQGVDSTDARILSDVLDGGGRVISHPDQVGGYKTTNTYTAPDDTDDDGIPDIYEALVGADPNRFDPHLDSNGNGYTNIEDYISGLLDYFDFDTSGQGQQDIRVEADDLMLIKGFTVDSNPHATEAKLIRATGSGSSEAAFVFGGVSGTYDMRIGYFDENDGASNFAIAVNGAEVDEWVWNNKLGSNWATSNTLTSHTIDEIALNTGDVITLIGTQDEMEPLRIDTIDLLA